MEFDDQLIEAVRNYPAIYCLKNHKYKDVMLKDNCWRVIGEQLNKSPLECKSKWRNIRDSYKRFQNKKKAGTAVSSKYEDKRLSFIGGDANEETIDSATPPLTKKKRKHLRLKKLKKIKENRNKDIQIDNIQSSSSIKDKSLVTRPETTPVHSFFNSMADIVCNFPADKIAQIRQQICNVVTETELLIISEREEGETNTSRNSRPANCSSSTTAIYLSPNAMSSSSASTSPHAFKEETEDSD